MAITKIQAIKATVNKSIRYIIDPNKTDGASLISGYNCEPLTAHLEFQMTAALAKEVKGDFTQIGGANNLAYHLIQSFAPFDKITPEEAHQIGKDLADELLDGKHEYVISTHIDKGCVHNHIIFNSVSFCDYNKFRSQPYKTARKIREISDRLCEDRGLYVIKTPQNKGKTRTEWEARKAGTSWKAKIEVIINETIQKADSYEEFVKLLKSAGVEIKEGKHLAFRLEGQQRFTRGKTIGEAYTKENIIKRIENKDISKSNIPFDKKIEWQIRRKKVHDTKELAQLLITIRREAIKNVSDFDVKITELKAKAQGVKSTINELDSKNRQYKEATKYLAIYTKLLPFKEKYDSSPSMLKQHYYNKYESELLAFENAQDKLKTMGVSVNTKLDNMVTFLKEQTEKTEDLYKQFKDIDNNIAALERAQKLVIDLLRQDKDQDREQEQQKEQTPQEIQR